MDLNYLLDLVRQHGDIIYAFVFAYAASHALLMALFAGYAAHMGVLDLTKTLILCCAGSFAGDVLRFWLARRYGDRLLSNYPRVARGAETVKKMVDRHALWMPLVHRYPHGVRGLGGFAYGLSQMTWPFFMTLNLAGAVLWSVSVVLTGYAFGSVSDKVLGDAVSGLSLASLVLFLGLSWILSRRLEQAMQADPGVKKR